MTTIPYEIPYRCQAAHSNSITLWKPDTRETSVFNDSSFPSRAQINFEIITRLALSSPLLLHPVETVVQFQFRESSRIHTIFFFFLLYFSKRVSPVFVHEETDVKPMSRFNLLDITAVSIEYRRGCVTNTGWSRKWLRQYIYIYIQFQWTTGCAEEEIVIVSDRSDRKLARVPLHPV